MADNEIRQKTFSPKNLPRIVMDSIQRLKTDLQRFIRAIISVMSAVTAFFIGIFTAVSNAYKRVSMLFFYMVHWLREVFHFDCKGYLVWVITLPSKYYSKCKQETRKYLWVPIADSLRRKVNRISRASRTRLREIAVYARGFREICRRLFLLVSDYTPGGKVTVTALLVVIAIMFSLKILTVVRVLIQIVHLVYSILAFLLHPLFLTLKDILSVFDPLLQVVFIVVRIIVQAVLSTFGAIGTFIWLNVVSIATGLYRCWESFANSTIVKFVWNATLNILARFAYVLLENFVFVFLPFMSKALYYLATLLVDISSVAYKNFFVVRVKIEDEFEYLNATGIGNCIFTFWAMLLAFRFRKRLSGTFFSEIDGKEHAITSSLDTVDRRKNGSKRTSTSQSSAKYDSSRRKTTPDDSRLQYRGKGKSNEGETHASEDGSEGKSVSEAYRALFISVYNFSHGIFLLIIPMMLN